MKRRFNEWLLLLPAYLGFVFWLSRDVDLSHVRSTSIKNEKGEPAQLSWCVNAEGVGRVVTFKGKDGLNHDGDEITGGEWAGRIYKVAEIGDRDEDKVKVYLLPENLGPFKISHSERFFLVSRNDLSKSINVAQQIDDWLDYYLNWD